MFIRLVKDEVSILINVDNVHSIAIGRENDTRPWDVQFIFMDGAVLNDGNVFHTEEHAQKYIDKLFNVAAEFPINKYLIK